MRIENFLTSVKKEMYDHVTGMPTVEALKDPYYMTPEWFGTEKTKFLNYWVNKRNDIKNISFLVARDAKSKNGLKNWKEFASFSNYESYAEWFETVPEEERVFYEGIAGHDLRRMYFDIDKKIDPDDKIDKIEFTTGFLNNFYDVLRNVFDIYNHKFEKECDKIKLNKNDIIICDSSTSSKISYHIIMPNCIGDNITCKMIFDGVKMLIKDEYKNMLDGAVYSRYQLMRLPSCHKLDKTNVKKILGGHDMEECVLRNYKIHANKIEYDHTLLTKVGYANGIEPEVKDKQMEKYEIKPCNDTAPLRKYIKTLLDIIPADAYSTWFKTCHIIGGVAKRYGIDLRKELRDYSFKSKKYNEVMVDKFYDAGDKDKISIGSLVYFARDINPGRVSESFKEFIKTDKSVAKLTNTQIIKNKLDMKVYDNYIRAEKFYSKKHMLPYPDGYETLIIKANKGVGKSYTMRKYIESKPDTRILILSFRISFSNEMMKRFNELGFELYSDIVRKAETNRIDSSHKRVIIQMESLYKLDWSEPPDILIVDEIISCGAQLFSKTMRKLNACDSIYRDLIKNSKTAVFMDADIETKHINMISEWRPNTRPYVIWNNYNKFERTMKEFYSVNENIIMESICKSVEDGERIVIAHNHSVKYSNGLYNVLKKKYAEKTILNYNSESMGNLEIRDSLVNVNESWKPVDILIYSPTISAGVSFDEINFDKFYGLFNDCAGTVNSIRQMIRRVRKISTMEYYYYIKESYINYLPENEEEIESKYINQRKNLYKIDIPESIPYERRGEELVFKYKDEPLYKDWIQHIKTKNMDANNFLTRFIIAERQAGVKDMRVLDAEDTLNGDDMILDIKKEILEIKEEEYTDIAESKTINETEMLNIVNRIKNGDDVEPCDMLSFKKFKLGTKYDVDIDSITADFVKKYSSKILQNRFDNLRAIKCRDTIGQSLERIKQIDINNDRHNEDKIMVDMKHKKLDIACDLVDKAGFTDLFSADEISRDDLTENLTEYKSWFNDNVIMICNEFNKKKSRVIKSEDWGVNLKGTIGFINGILDVTFGSSIKATDNHRKTFKLENKYLGEYFSLNEGDDTDKPVIKKRIDLDFTDMNNGESDTDDEVYEESEADD